ncbi:MAG: hypothetical protein CVU59_05050 [Deltaproteobacteria bacterium HGW-Deltaproteobacteria-17]|nr:MAG: hypothetical protein CVU59_05050 [Deltaproteobacteria bacterium HGW-Deltaproteobacteria-17]
MSTPLVYLDNNATTSVAPEVLEAMLPYLREAYGNPSSMHDFGGHLSRVVDHARGQLAALIGAHPDEIIFTSCGTESDNTAIASALAARTAMAKQTEPGSGERLNLRPVTVAFPADLFGIVKNVNEFQPQAVTVDNGNSMYGFFKPEGLVEVPFMTDATDWLMFGDPNEAEIVELAFLNGQQEPQMLVADNPAVGQMFVGGRIQYRISHDYEAECVDYRNAYKAVVAN